MQLDHTRIAIRQRGMLDTLDLSLHVARVYWRPLLATLALGTLPLLLLNHALIGWMADVDYREEFPVRYVWNMTLLVFLEAPLATALATAYLGQAMFQQRPRLGKVLREVRPMLPQLAWCQLLVRGVAAAWLLMLVVDRFADFSFAEMLLIFLALYAGVLRALRPFMNEIVLLERNPLRAPESQITIGRRSSLLHHPSSGDLMAHWCAAAVIGVLLTLAFYGGFVSFVGVFLYHWRPHPLLVQLCLPLSMWMAAGMLGVFRFLSYLDLRIRQEGWEVELLLRAEAARLDRGRG